MRYLPLGIFLATLTLPLTGFAADAQWLPDDPKNAPNASLDAALNSAKIENKIEQLKEDTKERAKGEEIYSIEIKVRKMPGGKLF